MHTRLGLALLAGLALACAGSVAHAKPVQLSSSAIFFYDSEVRLNPCAHLHTRQQRPICGPPWLWQLRPARGSLLTMPQHLGLVLHM